jgi:predicted O-methyltransferase YrrM
MLKIKSKIGRAIRSIQEKKLLRAYPQLNAAFSIDSNLSVLERVCLYNLAQNKQRVLEIGSYLGASACCFGLGMKDSPSDKMLFCVDTWNNDSMTEGNWDTYSDFVENTQEFDSYVIPVRGFSTEVVNEVASRTSYLDLLFIDGDHTYAGVKADWEAYKSFLQPSSIVILHDSAWAEGVMRVIEEDVKPVVSDFDSSLNMWWGTIKK